MRDPYEKLVAELESVFGPAEADPETQRMHAWAARGDSSPGLKVIVNRVGPEDAVDVGRQVKDLAFWTPVDWCELIDEVFGVAGGGSYRFHMLNRQGRYWRSCTTHIAGVPLPPRA